MDDFTSAIFIILIPVRCARARLWPTFTANCPTNRPPPFFFTCRSSERNRTACVFVPHTFSFSPSFGARRAEYDTAVGGLITIIIANAAVHRRVMVCTGRVTPSGGMRGCLKTASRRTGSLFNLRSRRAARESPVFAFVELT